MGGWHATAIHRAGGKITAVVDSDRARAINLAARFQGAHVYTDLGDALIQTRPAVVHLCTPASLHRQQAEQALKAGANLIVEKPLGVTLEDTESIFILAKHNDLLVCPVHQFIFQDGVQRIQTWLREAGDVLQISSVIRSAGSASTVSANLDALVADILPHPLSIFQVLVPGSIESDWKVSRSAPGELLATGIYHNNLGVGIGLSIEISLNARPTQNSLSVTTRTATFNADLFHGFAYRLSGKVSRTHKIIQPFEISLRQFNTAAGNLIVRLLNKESAYPGLQRLVSLFYQSLSTGGDSPIPIDDTLAVARARQAIMTN